VRKRVPGSDQQFNKESEQKYPRWVRWFAAAYVVSGPLATLLFFLLNVVACIVFWFGRTVDAWVVGLFAAGLACPALAGLFRMWFRGYGRRRWPEDDTEGDDESSP
jgi:hypothetical protein